MASETTYTTLTELAYSAIIQEEIMNTLVATVIMPKLVRQESLVGKPSIAMSFPKWPSATAAAVNEATDLTNTEYSTSDNTVTAGENGVNKNIAPKAELLAA